MTPPPLPPNGEILLYQTEHARARIECRFPNETLWLSQALLAVLFQVTVPTVNEHLKNIFEERELEPQPTIRNFRIVRREGKGAAGTTYFVAPTSASTRSIFTGTGRAFGRD